MTKSGLDSTLRFIETKDYERIHEASLKILAETGVIFESEAALTIFKKHGAKVEGQTVFLGKELVEDALKELARTYTFTARNPDKSVVVGQDLLVQPNAGAVYIQDLDKGRRLATIEDYGNIMKLAQSSEVANLAGAHPVNPSDVPDDYKHLYMCYEVLKNTDMPVLGFCMTGRQADQYLDMVEIAFGGDRQYLSGVQYANVSVNPLSPLKWATDSLETIMAYSRRGQGVYLLPCIMAGISGPIHPFGTILLQNVEILSGIVLTKLVNPTTPVVYTPSSTMGYMKKASYITGTPEMMLVNVPLLQMAHDYYHLPTRCMCGMTDAKVPDGQAALETMQNLMMGILGGADILLECLGVLDAIMTTSYEKHIIDEEIIARIKCIRQGIDRSDAALSVDSIQEVAHHGSYLMHHDTVAHCRDTFANTVSECESYDEWQENGAYDIAERANQIYKRRLAEAPPSFLTAEQENDLRRYMDKIIR